MRAGDRGVPRVQRLARQRPRDAAPGAALPGLKARRALVPACAALDRGLGGGQGAARDPRGDARERAQVRATLGAQALCARSELAIISHANRRRSMKRIALAAAAAILALATFAAR